MKLVQLNHLLQSTPATVEEDETQYLLFGENRFDLNPEITGAPHAPKTEPVQPTEDERNAPEEELKILETPLGE